MGRRKITAILLALSVALGGMPATCVWAAENVVPSEPEVAVKAAEDSDAAVDVITSENAVADAVTSEDAVVDAVTSDDAITEENEVLDADAYENAESTVGRSDGTGPFSIDRWWAAAKEKASEADHVIGPDTEIGDIFGYDKLTYSVVHYYTVILPGETVAILPELTLNNYGIQGGISHFGFTIWQLEETVADTTFLTRSTPERTTLTPLESSTMPIPYGDRTVDHPNDPVRILDDSRLR